MFLSTFLLFQILFYGFFSANDASGSVSVKKSSYDSAFNNSSGLAFIDDRKVEDIKRLLELLEEGDCPDPYGILRRWKGIERHNKRIFKRPKKQSEAELLRQSLSVLSKYLKAHSRRNPHSLNKQQERNFNTIREGIHQLYKAIVATSHQSELKPSGEYQGNLLTSLLKQLTHNAFTPEPYPNLTPLLQQSQAHVYGPLVAYYWNIRKKPYLKSVLESVYKLYENHRENSWENDGLKYDETEFLKECLKSLKLYLDAYHKKYYDLLTWLERSNLYILRKEVNLVIKRFNKLNRPTPARELNPHPVVLPISIVSPVLLPIYIGQQVTEEPKTETTNVESTVELLTEPFTEVTETTEAFTEGTDIISEAPSRTESTIDETAVPYVTEVKPPEEAEHPIEITTEGQPLISIDVNGNNQQTGGEGNAYPVYEERPLPSAILHQLTILGYGQLYEKYIVRKPHLLSSSSHHSIRYPAFFHEE